MFDKNGKRAKTIIFNKDTDSELLAWLTNNPDFLNFNDFCKKLLREAMSNYKKQKSIEPLTLEAIEQRVARLLKSELKSITINTNQPTQELIADDESDLANMF